MFKFCFVILHYNAIDDTIECIESILNNINYNNLSIVVVDNNSQDNSGKVLLEKYQTQKNVYVLLNDENIGFAGGNNIGYRFAVDKINAEFIAIINNDTVINDKIFVDKILDLYNVEKFHIMGPDIITKNGFHQNPYKLRGISLEEVNDFIVNYKQKLFTRTVITIITKNRFLDRLIKLIRKPKPRVEDTNYLVTHKNIVLHGSAIVFSKLYIDKEEHAFHPGTFMYGEEDILFHICMQKGYKIIYSPVTSIYHKEDASTDSVLKAGYQKFKFIYKNQRDSYLILKNIIEQNHGEIKQ